MSESIALMTCAIEM